MTQQEIASCFDRLLDLSAESADTALLPAILSALPFARNVLGFDDSADGQNRSQSDNSSKKYVH